jgi:predicted enzyme related to lactoylglutathione lyase
MQLVQSRLLVRRFSEAYDFYGDVLGLSPQRGDRAGTYEKFSFPRGEAAVALQVRESMEEVVPLFEGDRAIIAVRVDDVDAVARAIVERGGRLAAPPALRFGRLRSAYVRDPEGNLIELQTW